MRAAGSTNATDWIAGSPWRDLRLHRRVYPGPGLRVTPVAGIELAGRNPEWILTDDDIGGLALPITRSQLAREPASTERIAVSVAWHEGQPWLQLLCVDQTLEEVFFRFCQFVLQRVAEGDDPREAVVRGLERFQQLFIRGANEVSSEAIAGLFVELSVLIELLDFGLDAIPCWLGPFGETHDFVFRDLHIEVKSFPASGERRFKVSSISQLETPEGGDLFLVGLRLLPGPNTIADLVERIKAMCSAERWADFLKALEAVGCVYPVDEPWKRKCFSAGKVEAWKVDENFPRIVLGSFRAGCLPHGVSDLRYTVSLEQAEHLRWQFEALAARIRAVLEKDS